MPLAIHMQYSGMYRLARPVPLLQLLALLDAAGGLESRRKHRKEARTVAAWEQKRSGEEQPYRWLVTWCFQSTTHRDIRV